jgi:hypothetical protein
LIEDHRRIKKKLAKATRDLLLVIPAKAGIQFNMLCAAHKTYVERFARCI